MAKRVKGRTIVKWAIGVIAIVVLIGVGGVVCLFVAGFIELAFIDEFAPGEG